MGIAAALTLGGCSQMLDPSMRDVDLSLPSSGVTEPEAEPKSAKPRPVDSRAAEAARQACLTYDDAARNESLTDAELASEFQAVAVLAMVAKDRRLENAADALWAAAQQGDARAVEAAAGRFVRECRRLVPAVRLASP